MTRWRVAIAPLFGLLCACGDPAVQPQSQAVVDDGHETQATPMGEPHAGWLYATARWVEALRYAANGQRLDISQRYWTYWAWYTSIVEDGTVADGDFARAARIVKERGVMRADDFGDEGEVAAADPQLRLARVTLENELSEGRLASMEARADRALVLTVLNDVMRPPSWIAEDMRKAFGDDGTKTYANGLGKQGGDIQAPQTFAVRYRRYHSYGDVAVVDTSLAQALDGWRWLAFPTDAHAQRDALTRLALASFDRQAVLVGWHVDFDALVTAGAELGSFSSTAWETSEDTTAPVRHLSPLADLTVPVGDELVKASDPLDPLADADTVEMAMHNAAGFSSLSVPNAWSVFDERLTAIDDQIGDEHVVEAEYLRADCEPCGGLVLEGFALPPGYAP